jgi:glycosyltransferase involved in cell wall biosynthesis
MTKRLRVAVPAHLLDLAPAGGHGKVWHRVLHELGEAVEIVPLPLRRGLRRRSRADVVLCSGHDDLPTTDAPVVAQVHEAGWHEPELRAVLDPAFLAHIAPRTERAVRTVARVIVPSQQARADLIRAYQIDARRVRAVPHGVDPGFTPAAPGGRALVARALGGRDRPYILYAATLHPRKNLAALREAMAVLVAAGRPHALAVAGGLAPDRADSSELERAAGVELPGTHGRVARLPSPTDPELAALMSAADAFCLPSLYEGFGLTALEAMACGAPVVCSDRGALPEVVGEAGVIAAATADGMRAGLERVLDEPGLAPRLAAAGPVRAAAFTWTATAAGWLEVLREAAAGTGGPIHSRSG